MNYMTTGWLTCSLICYAIAEYLSKKWVVTQQNWLAALAVVGYACNAVFWFPALKNHGSLTVLGSIYAVCYVLATVVIGMTVFGETVTTRQCLGIVFALIAVSLLS